MALVSPGVQVTVIDESFYTPAEPGTTPLIVVATAENKVNASGTGTAVGTTAANAGKAFRITSQRELVETFGVPFFETTATGNPVHGGERNEYGLLAAYSFLGSSSSAFIVRANVNLNQLVGSAIEPGAEPDDGQWWINTSATAFGIQEWNSATVSAGGQRFTLKTPIVLTDSDDAKIEAHTGIISSETYRRPKGSVGSIGDYAVVFETVDGSGTFSAIRENARLFYKSVGNSGEGVEAGEWVLVGSQEWTASHPTITSGTVTSLEVSDRFTINGTSVTVPSGASALVRLQNLASAINSASIAGVSATVSNGKLFLYSTGATEVDGDSTLGGRIVIANDSGTAVGSDLTTNPGDLGIISGTYLQPAVQQTPHTQIPLFKRTDQPLTFQGYPTGSVWVKTTEPGNGSRFRVSRWNAGTDTWVAYSAPLYASGNSAIYYLDRSGGGLNIPTDSIFVQTNAQEHVALSSLDSSVGLDATFETVEWKLWRRNSTGNTIITSKVITTDTLTGGAKSFRIKESLLGEIDLSDGTPISFTATGTAADAVAIAAAVNAAGLQHVEASVTADNELQIFHKTGGDFRLTDITSTPIATLFTPFSINTLTGTQNFFTAPAGSPDSYVASNWRPLASSDFAAGSSEPLNEPADGQLWYNPEVGDVDIMAHNGTTWVGYLNAFPNSDPAGPQVAATEPTTQSDGSALVSGDLWISTADLENFPIIYRWDGDLLEWILIDNADQVSEEGILFTDARWDLNGTSTEAASIVDLLSNNHLDPDAPDPALYPKGMLLWNTRRSSGNVKRYINNYINTAEDNLRLAGNPSMANYATDRWVTASPNQEDGSGTFRRKAQRSVVVQGIKSVIDTSEEIRDTERRNFNIIACPGYAEAIQNLISLNIDRGLTSFVLGDTPFRLASDATTLLNWASNANLALDNGDDGLVSYDEYAAVYYPSGFTTDLSGSNAVVPSSHMMLKTIALSDAVSYPWFAPAGTRRGGIVNATSVGYIDSLTGEFQTVALNEGQRDTLYDLKINPVVFFVGVGHVAFGQKTRARNASALDRINVARLVVYLRSQLNKLAKPYLFEPNDQITRDEVRGAVESLLLELVGLRAIYDYVVVCDESNNTPSRVDRNELYVDIAIEPTKAIEFIYIPLRLRNTGEI